ncbi:hypothetical protein [Phenylobacterium sp.]|uniref:hypothetical protein n=1 Tax=Phenylobacterium sp. TaxID=1871053 RepID=UPI0025EFFDEF|nr:hypothetical protein [Phenylobacterium sp.]
MPAFSLSVLLRALIVWLAVIASESLNGALRRVVLNPDIDFALRQGSVVVGAVMIFVITWFFLDWIRIRTARGALAMGALWVALTFAFELALGRLTGLGWARILADYDLIHGGLMPLGLLAMGLTPWAVRRLKAGRPGRLRPEDRDLRGTP